MAQDPTIMTEVLKIKTEMLPPLTSYRLETGNSDVQTVGGKLAYRLRRAFSGHWVWTSNRILTDGPRSDDEMTAILKDLWQDSAGTYRQLLGISRHDGWAPHPQAVSDFVARGLIDDMRGQIRDVLLQNAVKLKNLTVERLHDVRGWVVDGSPAISISVSSRMVLDKDLMVYAAGLGRPEDLIGLMVGDKNSTLKGEIIGIVGNLSEHRARLLSVAQQEQSQSLLRNAPDGELVVQVLSGRNEYDYCVGALRIILRTEDFERFSIDAKQAMSTLQIEPGYRANMIRPIAAIIREKGYIGESYNSQNSPNRFLDVGLSPNKLYMRFGDGRTAEHEEKAVWNNLRNFGLYRRRQEFNNSPLKLGFMNSMKNGDIRKFSSELERHLTELGFDSLVVDDINIQTRSRAKIEGAIQELENSEPHVIIGFLEHDSDNDDDETGAYHHFKQITIGKGLPSQAIFPSGLTNPYAMRNIVLGILGKTGNIPFVFAEPLPYADIVVGIDIASEKKTRLAGSVNATAMVRVYFSDGEFMHYAIHDAPLEGETVPDHVLQSLFPIKDFEGKRVVVHRDGYFRGGEKEALTSWGRGMGAEFKLVEVIKSGTPRLYSIFNKQISRPQKGQAFRLSQREAFLVSSLPPFTNATPNPLHIRSFGDLTIDEAIHSVLSMTTIHYGSLRAPRLPVDIHYSDKIAYMALRGIKPKELEGNVPYWL